MPWIDKNADSLRPMKLRYQLGGKGVVFPLYVGKEEPQKSNLVPPQGSSW